MAASRKTGAERKKTAAALSPAEAYAEAQNRIAKLPKDANRLDLSGLKQLTEIPSEIKRLAALDTLELRGTRITSLASVASLPLLRVLQIPNCPIASLKPLAKCENLAQLYLSRTKVLDLRPIAGHELTHLNIQNCPISALEPYPFLRSLVYLNANETKFRDIEALREAKELTFLSVNETNIEDLSPIAEITQLQNINISETRVATLEALSRLLELEEINASDTQIRDLVPLSKLSQLNWLDVSNTDVYDLSPIADLKNIVRLDIRETRVKSLRPIANYERLRYLTISNTDIDDIDVVADMVSLIPDKLDELRGWRGFNYRSTPAARHSPFARLLGRSYDGRIETVETINYLRRARGLPEVYPSDYERGADVEEVISQLGEENDSEVLRQRPATFGFALRDGKIEAEPRILPSSNQALSAEIYAAVVPKVARARERFA